MPAQLAELLGNGKLHVATRQASVADLVRHHCKGWDGARCAAGKAPTPRTLSFTSPRSATQVPAISAPPRAQAVDEATQKAMMAWYHKRQEVQKALDENQDDAYMQASWASANSLKAHFSGVSEVRLPH